MRSLDCHCHAAQNDNLLAPVKPVGFARWVLKRYIGFRCHGPTRFRANPSNGALIPCSMTITAHSQQSWAHINMLGAYDFSDKKIADRFGILPLKTGP